MANAGIKGSQAGSSLRSGLTRLAKLTKEAAAYMDKYGISITDANGNMYSEMELMVQLREKLGGLSEAEQAQAASALFGKQSMAGWLAIVKGPDEDFNKLTCSVYNCEGTAQNMADTMQDNLSGQITQLNSTLEGLAISFGKILIPAIKKAVGWIITVLQTLVVALGAGLGIWGAINLLEGRCVPVARV